MTRQDEAMVAFMRRNPGTLVSEHVWREAWAAAVAVRYICPRCSGSGGVPVPGFGQVVCPVCLGKKHPYEGVAHLHQAGKPTCGYPMEKGDSLAANRSDATCVPCLREVSDGQ